MAQRGSPVSSALGGAAGNPPRATSPLSVFSVPCHSAQPQTEPWGAHVPSCVPPRLGGGGFTAVSFHRAEHLFSLHLLLLRSPLTHLWISSHLPPVPPAPFPKDPAELQMKGRGSTLQNPPGGTRQLQLQNRCPRPGCGIFGCSPRGDIARRPPPGSSPCRRHAGGDGGQRGEGCSAPLGRPVPRPRAAEAQPPRPPWQLGPPRSFCFSFLPAEVT